MEAAPSLRNQSVHSLLLLEVPPTSLIATTFPFRSRGGQAPAAEPQGQTAEVEKAGARHIPSPILEEGKGERLREEEQQE